MPPQPDSFAPFDPILAAADTDVSPWDGDTYVPDLDLFRQLLAIPISEGSSQQSGRMAKAMDAWIAQELRRAGFPEEAVCPRTRQPRMLPAEVAPVEAQLDELLALVDQSEQASGQRLQPVALRRAIMRLRGSLPGSADARVLGRFYVKQVDVLVSSWQRGPDVLVSTKTMFSSYLKNIPNRYEEAVGEATNLRNRHPMTAMGYAYLARNNIFDEGAFVALRDVLTRLRHPDGPFDATMLLIADWDTDAGTLTSIEEASDELGASRFFEDILNTVMRNTPVGMHQQVRLRRMEAPPPGGMPSPDDLVAADEPD
jgi:hypothetical protein